MPLTRISVTEAAKIFDANPQFIRECMKANRFSPPIGVACRMPGGRWSYKVYKEKLDAFINEGGSVNGEGSTD